MILSPFRHCGTGCTVDVLLSAVHRWSTIHLFMSAVAQTACLRAGRNCVLELPRLCI